MREGRIMFTIGFILVAVIVLTIWYGCDHERILSPTESSVAVYNHVDAPYNSSWYAVPEQDMTSAAIETLDKLK